MQVGLRRVRGDGNEQPRSGSTAPGDHPPPEVQTRPRPAGRSPQTSDEPKSRTTMVPAGQPRFEDVIGAEVPVHDPAVRDGQLELERRPALRWRRRQISAQEHLVKAQRPVLAAAARVAWRRWSCRRPLDARHLRLAVSTSSGPRKTGLDLAPPGSAWLRSTVDAGYSPSRSGAVQLGDAARGNVEVPERLRGCL